MIPGSIGERLRRVVRFSSGDSSEVVVGKQDLRDARIASVKGLMVSALLPGSKRSVLLVSGAPVPHLSFFIVSMP